MKETSVLAVIVVLLCFCSSFGYGDERIEEARRGLRKRYAPLVYYSRHPNAQSSAAVAYRHIGQLECNGKIFKSWIQQISGCSHEQLSIPPESSMNVDLLKLAAEYHLWQSGSYYARFISLNKAAKRRIQIHESYPSARKCRVFAMRALKLSETHRNLYKKYRAALGEEERKDLMKEIKLPNYIASQELNLEYPRNEYYHDFVGQKLISVESYGIFQIKTKLDMLIKGLTKQIKNIDSAPVYKPLTVLNLLTPTGSLLNPVIIPMLCKWFSIRDLSQLPNKASRSDGAFLEVALLFNQYRSLWHELRHIEFVKFLLQLKPSEASVSVERLKEAIKLENDNFKLYDSLSRAYGEMLNKYQPDRIASAQDAALAADSMEVDGQTDLSTTFKSVGNFVSQENDKTAEVQFLDENIRSNRLARNKLDASDSVAIEVNGQAQDGELHKTKRYKCHNEANIQPPSEAGMIEKEMKFPKLDLTLAPPGIGETEEDIVEMAPKRLKLTGLEENPYRWFSNLDDLHPSPSESSRTGENSYSFPQIQLFHFI